jgi:hypothetical protein
MSKTKIVQSFSLATLFLGVAFGSLIPLPARALSLTDCVDKYKREYGWSSETANNFCVKGGTPGCLARAYELFHQDNVNDPRGQARDFCLRSGNGACLTQSYAAFKQADLDNPSLRAASFCRSRYP